MSVNYPMSEFLTKNRTVWTKVKNDIRQIQYDLTSIAETIDMKYSELDRKFSISKIFGRLSNIEYKIYRLSNSIDRSNNTQSTDHQTDSILSSPPVRIKSPLREYIYSRVG